MANDDFSEPPRRVDSKYPSFIFYRFLGLGHLRGPGVSLGRILGVLSIEPLLGGVLSIEPLLGGLYRTPPPPHHPANENLASPTGLKTARAHGWGGRDALEGRTSEAAPEAVRQAVGGGCQSGWGRLLSVTNATEAGTCRQRDSGSGDRLGTPEGVPPPLPMHPSGGGGGGGGRLGVPGFRIRDPPSWVRGSIYKTPHLQFPGWWKKFCPGTGARSPPISWGGGGGLQKGAPSAQPLQTFFVRLQCACHTSDAGNWMLCLDRGHSNCCPPPIFSSKMTEKGALRAIPQSPPLWKGGKGPVFGGLFGPCRRGRGSEKGLLAPCPPPRHLFAPPPPPPPPPSPCAPALVPVRPFRAAPALRRAVAGKGKNASCTGALLCVLPNGKKFSVGSGLTDKDRRSPPKIGPPPPPRVLGPTRAAMVCPTAAAAPRPVPSALSMPLTPPEGPGAMPLRSSATGPALRTGAAPRLRRAHPPRPTHRHSPTHSGRDNQQGKGTSGFQLRGGGGGESIARPNTGGFGERLN